MNNLSTMLTLFSTFPCPTEYTISFQKRKSSCEMEAMPKNGWLRFKKLYEEALENPKSHCDDLIRLYQQYPKVPEIANLLSYVYLRLEKKQEAEKLIEKTWQQHPHHLPARINYADLALRLGKKELVGTIFDHCFDLKTLYPDEPDFYFAEFRAFMTLMGFYHLALKKREIAEECYTLSFQTDPFHPSVIALEKKLSKTLLSRFRKICKVFTF